MQKIDFWHLLSLTQEHISEQYAAVLTEKEKLPQLPAYIEKYLLDTGYAVEGMNARELIDRLYSEMAEYSILTPYLGAPDLEEIDLNSWDDIALITRDGKTIKLKEHFRSPQHAVDIVKRLLHHSGMIIDNATPVAQGHLPGSTRVTALKEPVVDNEIGISCSIRLLRPNTIDRNKLLTTEFATSEMLSFLEMCVRYGVSVVIAGATSSGKTTLLNVLLQSLPAHTR
ncbi:MAG: ATPase, T2SS/T4P/T4SS family, partial [Ethanoligenens sp.]